jgi:BirA family biotin operon repressor/biotin-[acetyl-CoA-carboxylase] ligase
MSNYLKLINLDTVNSTNTYAWKLAQDGAKEVTIVRAKAQTAGKGRLDRKWSSPKDKGIYISFIFRPPNDLKEISDFPVVLALAVAKMLPDNLNISIKWPNDVLLNNKKIAGILVESKGSGSKSDFIVAGIGVNINSQKEEIPAHATSLYLETAKKQDIDRLSKKLVKETLTLYKQFKTGHLKEILIQVAEYQTVSKRFKHIRKDAEIS